MRNRNMNNGRETAGNNSDVTRVNESNVLVGTTKNNDGESKFKSNALI